MAKESSSNASPAEGLDSNSLLFMVLTICVASESPSVFSVKNRIIFISTIYNQLPIQVGKKGE